MRAKAPRIAAGAARAAGARAPRAALAAASLLGALAAASCARVSPPPGGPLDSEAPRLLGSLPAPDSAGVAPSSEVRLVFSERMNRRDVMKALRVIPRVDFERTAWSGDTLRLQPAEGWPASGATHVWIGTQAEDTRGNRLGAPYVQRFTTEPAWGTGTILGRVVGGREMGADAQLVVFAIPGTSADSAHVAGAAPAAIALPGADGAYRLTRLAPGPYRVAAFVDRDGDPRESTRGEAWAAPDEAFVLASADSASVVPDFLVGTLDSAGTITGEILADSGAVVVEAHADSSRTDRAARALRSGPGPFTLDVATGRDYFLRAFTDADGDSVLAGGEKAVELDEPVSLRLVSRAGGIRFDLRGAAAAGGNP